MQLQVTGDDEVLGIKPNKGRKEAVGQRLRAGAASMLRGNRCLRSRGRGCSPCSQKAGPKLPICMTGRLHCSTTSQWSIFLLGKNFPVEIMIKAY